MDDPFDPSRLGHPPDDLSAPPSSRPPRHRAGEKFLKGPIPWGWVQAAAALPGKALAVGVAVWFEAGCRNARSVPITLARLTRLGMSRDAASRAVRRLESAGLVAVDRPRGRGLVVTLCDRPG
jgi:hypothetical protein